MAPRLPAGWPARGVPAAYGRLPGCGVVEPDRKLRLGRYDVYTPLQIGQLLALALRQVFGLLQLEVAARLCAAEVGEFRGDHGSVKRRDVIPLLTRDRPTAAHALAL
jgi:hypothetical protein